MTLPDRFRVKPKPSTSRPTTTRAPMFFNSFADAKAREKGKEKEELRSRKPIELKRLPPPTFYLDPALRRSGSNDNNGPISKLANSQASGKSVLGPPAVGSVKPASQAKSLVKPGSSSSKVEFKVQPIPFYNPGASKPKPPSHLSQKPLSSSANVLKPLGIPKFKLPPTKPAIDPEKLKNMVTPSTTKFALATNPTTKEGARELAAIMCAHQAKNAEPQNRDLGMSPERRDAKGRLKFVRCVGERTATPLPIQTHHIELRIVKLLKRPTAIRLKRGPPPKSCPKGRSPTVTSKPSRALTKKPKPLPARAKPPATATALCDAGAYTGVLQVAEHRPAGTYVQADE